MSGNNTQTPANAEEPHVALPETAPSGAQGTLIDILQAIDGLFMGDGSLGNTNFEGYSLEQLVAFTEGGNPTQLTNAGDDLFTAGKAFETAGNELKTNLGRVEWDGEAGESFRVWSEDFANKTLALGDYAATAGTQIKTAGEGLTEVKAAMPKNYTGEAGGWTAADREADPQDYQQVVAADKAETSRRRQEAIVQMNKLASYYQVTSSTLGALEPPVYKPIDAPVPQPSGRVDTGDTGDGSDSTTSPTERSVGTGDKRSIDSVETSPPDNGTQETDPGLIPGHQPKDPVPTAPVGTDLDSVIVPTAPTGTPPGPGPIAPSPAPTPGPAPTAPTGYMPPPQRGLGKAPAISGTPPRGPVSPAGGPRTAPGANPVRPGTRGPITPTLGRTGPGPMGGTSTRGVPPGGRGITGPSAGGGRTPAVGRSGPVGPTSTVGGRGATQGPMGRSGGAGRPGVVGGQSPTSGAGRGTGRGAPGVGRGVGAGRPPMGGAGSRLPRGTVVGGDGVSSGRGVTRGAARGGAAEGRGVVGGGRGAGQRGFTQGGAGLAGRRNEDGRDPEQTDSERPDYLVEDEETWTAGQGESGPRVVE